MIHVVDLTFALPIKAIERITQRARAMHEPKSRAIRIKLAGDLKLLSVV